MTRAGQNREDYQSKILYELSALILNMMRYPPPPSIEVDRQRITPTGFASMLLGISLALMLCGSVTFFLGFILMPWVLGFVITLYLVGIISNISMIGRSILSHTPRKDIPSWKFL